MHWHEHGGSDVNKPCSEACENNKRPILAVIAPLLKNSRSVLEIGSGTGQHAVFFAENMPQLIWHTTDREENHAAINQWLEDAGLENIRAPLALDVCRDDWPVSEFDAVFSANTAHIMNWDQVKCMFAGVGRLLADQGLFLLYGPFNYNNDYTSDSNRRFDAWLKANDPRSGIRNFEDLQGLAEEAALQLIEDFPMPANNRILCWQKR